MATLLVFGAPASFAADAPKSLLYFRAEARIELDADGKLVRVAASPDLPEAVRTLIEKRVATWTFAPPTRNGVHGPAASWLEFGACAIPAGGGYRMGLDFKRVGPRPANGAWPAPGTMGMLKVAFKQDWEGDMKVDFVVGADGTAKFERTDIADARMRKAVTPVLEDWLRALRFDPEVFGGTPVATRQSTVINIRLDPKPEERKRWLAEQAARTPECTVAGQAPAPVDGVTVDSVDSIVEIRTAG